MHVGCTRHDISARQALTTTTNVAALTTIVAILRLLQMPQHLELQQHLELPIRVLDSYNQPQCKNRTTTIARTTSSMIC